MPWEKLAERATQMRESGMNEEWIWYALIHEDWRDTSSLGSSEES